MTKTTFNTLKKACKYNYPYDTCQYHQNVDTICTIKNCPLSPKPGRPPIGKTRLNTITVPPQLKQALISLSKSLNIPLSELRRQAYHLILKNYREHTTALICKGKQGTTKDLNHALKQFLENPLCPPPLPLHLPHATALTPSRCVKGTAEGIFDAYFLIGVNIHTPKDAPPGYPKGMGGGLSGLSQNVLEGLRRSI